MAEGGTSLSSNEVTAQVIIDLAPSLNRNSFLYSSRRTEFLYDARLSDLDQPTELLARSLGISWAKSLDRDVEVSKATYLEEIRPLEERAAKLGSCRRPPTTIGFRYWAPGKENWQRGTPRYNLTAEDLVEDGAGDETTRVTVKPPPSETKGELEREWPSEDRANFGRKGPESFGVDSGVEGSSVDDNTAHGKYPGHY